MYVFLMVFRLLHVVTCSERFATKVGRKNWEMMETDVGLWNILVCRYKMFWGISKTLVHSGKLFTKLFY